MYITPIKCYSGTLYVVSKIQGSKFKVVFYEMTKNTIPVSGNKAMKLQCVVDDEHSIKLYCLFCFRYPRINRESLRPIASSFGPESAEG